MKDKRKFNNLLYICIIFVLTLLPIIILPNIPGYLLQKENAVLLNVKYIVIFLLADIVLIGVPAFINWFYIKDYSKIKSVWFFILFGTLIGVLLGERANPVMLIPYTIIMFIYANIYKRIRWWKVALTSYLAGIILENALNRATMQSSTLIWIAFFICPYFATKIYENINKKLALKISSDFKWAYILSSIIVLTGLYLNKINKNFNIGLIIITATLPFLLIIVYKIIKTIKRKIY
ncbi:hypothetical protein J4229_00380 [Candidatus Pacearchaeota archaeon]|nr:hypothetical protein [Candidatus Pacearchaeota archaeon]